MARIRTMKPDFFRSPSIRKLSFAARYFCLGIITEADDEGRFVASARALAGALFPHDDGLPTRRVEGWLQEVASIGTVVLYSADGVRYGYFPQWETHQRISHPSPSKLPTPPDCLAKLSGESPEGFRPSCAPAEQGTGNREQGTGKSEAAPPDVDRPEIRRLCTLLADLIQANGAKRPIPEAPRWRDSCRLLLDRDGKTEAEIEAVMRWATADDFWRSNILSMPKLREKFDQLSLRMRSNGKVHVDRASEIHAQAEELRRAGL